MPFRGNVKKMSINIGIAFHIKYEYRRDKLRYEVDIGENTRMAQPVDDGFIETNIMRMEFVKNILLVILSYA